jgi:CheY-like chemotaxis protein
MRSTSGNSKGKGWEVLNQQYTGNTIQNNIFDVDRSQLTEHEKRLADMLEQQLCQMENVNHQLLERAKHQTSNVQLDYASMQGMQGGQQVKDLDTDIYNSLLSKRKQPGDPSDDVAMLSDHGSNHGAIHGSQHSSQMSHPMTQESVQPLTKVQALDPCASFSSVSSVAQSIGVAPARSTSGIGSDMSVTNSVSEWQVVSANVQLNDNQQDASKLKWLTDCLDTAQSHAVQESPLVPEESPSWARTDERFEVLVLDDSPFEGEAVALLCRANGYEVRMVEQEDDALNALKSPDGDRINFILVDFHQPKPFDCFKFIQKVAKLRPETPVAVVSADEKPGFLLNCIYIRSLAGFFLKPLSYQHVGLFRSIVSQRLEQDAGSGSGGGSSRGSGGGSSSGSGGSRSGSGGGSSSGSGGGSSSGSGGGNSNSNSNSSGGGGNSVATTNTLRAMPTMHGLPILRKVVSEQFTVLSYMLKEQDIALMKEVLQSVGWGINFLCRSVHSAMELKESLGEGGIDIAIIDGCLPRKTFLQNLQACGTAGVPCLRTCFRS